MSTAATILLVTAAASPKIGSAGPALWMLIMLVALVPWYLVIRDPHASDRALRVANGAYIAFGFFLFLAIILATPDEPGAEPRCGPICRMEKKAQNVKEGRGCYTHIDTMAPCPGKEESK